MSDPNMADFYDRVRRYEKMRAKGYAHEAAGALGRSFYVRPARRRRSVLMPVVFALACGLLLKAAIYYNVGADAYQARLAQLQAGQGFDRLGAWLMQADPLTEYLAGQMAMGLAALRA